MSKLKTLLFVLLASTFILTACGPNNNDGDINNNDNNHVNNAVNNTSDDTMEDSHDGAMYDLDGQEVTIAIENAYLPFNYISLETGEPGGWDYDVWDEICARLNCVPVYVEAGWDGMIQAVADGQFDAAADGITITEARAEIVDYSMGYVNIEQRLLVRLGDNRFDGIDAFTAGDFIMATQTGTTNYETAIQYLPEDRIQAFEQFSFAVQALIAGDVDAVIIDETSGLGYLGENADELELIGDSISSDQLGFIFPLGSELVEPVDYAIQSMMDDGFLQGVNALYFGPDFDITYDDIGDGAYASDDEETSLPDLDGLEITVAIENAYLPFNFISLETGEAGGWDYEVWDGMCELLNCVPVYVEAGWDGMIQAVADGQFDAAADGITITETRAEIVDYSMGYVNIEQRLLVRLGDDRFDGIDAFTAGDFIMATQTGTTNYETAIQYLPEDRIQAFEQFSFAVQALIAGDVDAVIIDETSGLGYLGENADELELIGDSISSDQLGFIFPLGSELVEPINAALLEMMGNGSLQEINAFYFGPDFDVTYDDIGDGAYAD
jgi:ABC-type amino acid transport substrate-binding protein